MTAGLTLRSHPLALLRPALHRLGLSDTRRLAAMRQGSWLRLLGLVLMRQRPATSKGVVFVTVEDEHGQANIVVYAHVADRDRAALVGARLLVVEGRIERLTEQAKIPIAHVIARRLIDRSDLPDGLEAADGGRGIASGDHGGVATLGYWQAACIGGRAAALASKAARTGGRARLEGVRGANAAPTPGGSLDSLAHGPCGPCPWGASGRATDLGAEVCGLRQQSDPVQR